MSRFMSTPTSLKTSFIPPGPVFPPEITDSIIHQLSRDTPVLRICGLVCRAWLPASRYILHETLSLRGEDIPGFLEIIGAAENTYFATLRAIAITLCENGPTQSLLELLPQFLCLKTFRVHTSIFHYEVPVLSRVTTLEFYGTQFRSFAAWTNLLSRVPNVKNLKLVYVSCGSMEGWAPARAADIIPAKSPRLTLDTLSIQISDDPRLLDWLASEESGPLTIDLTLLLVDGTLVDEIGSPRVSKYLRHLNTSLKRLFFQFAGISHVDNLDFSSNTSLQSIRLDFLNMGRTSWRRQLTGDAEIYLGERLPALLERFRSSQIEELIIDIHTSPAIKKPLGVNRLVSVLSSSPFSHLRKLQFNGRWEEDSYKVLRKIFATNVIDRLPASSSRTIVLFDPTHS
ncbi:hypothetical protein B0H19DRAFT_1057057 [Mycena capillaripes]|nr:hypothetical protein B0H19DRAFT_1057057 [Mycena capillaripes]